MSEKNPRHLPTISNTFGSDINKNERFDINILAESQTCRNMKHFLSKFFKTGTHDNKMGNSMKKASVHYQQT